MGSSQRLNRYAYCEGNPVSLVDPFGLSPNGTNSGNSIWDVFTVHDVLGLFGFAGNFMGPPGVVISIVCDVADAVLYFWEVEPVKGALSLVCAIPGIGDVIGAVRNGTRLAAAAKVVGTTIRAAQKLYVTAESAKTALDLAGDAKMEYAVNGGNPAEVIAYADKTNTRLPSRYYKFIRCDKASSVAVVAIARELACFVWE